MHTQWDLYEQKSLKPELERSWLWWLCCHWLLQWFLDDRSSQWSKILGTITVVSHEHHGVSNYWQTDACSTVWYANNKENTSSTAWYANNKENTKALHVLLTTAFTSLSANNVESTFVKSCQSPEYFLAFSLNSVQSLVETVMPFCLLEPEDINEVKFESKYQRFLYKEMHLDMPFVNVPR